ETHGAVPGAHGGVRQAEIGARAAPEDELPARIQPNDFGRLGRRNLEQPWALLAGAWNFHGFAASVEIG
ncbi:MAG TPA: hypothetical protein VFZ53_24315, partial [Polyangiaceae bacterium]